MRRLYKSRRWLRAPVAARYMWCESLTTCSYTYLIYYAEVCRPLKTPPKLDGRAVVNKTVCMVQEWGGAGETGEAESRLRAMTQPLGHDMCRWIALARQTNNLARTSAENAPESKLLEFRRTR